MRHHLIHPDTKAFWNIELSDDEELRIRTGGPGKRASVQLIDLDEEDHPPEVIFATRTEAQLAKGFIEVLPDDLQADVEAGHAVTLQGRMREFYIRQEYKRLQHALCGRLECRVDFATNAVQGDFDQSYVCPKTGARRALIPIAGKLFGNSSSADEQQWIGIDASLPDGPVFDLSTSGSFSEAYADLDAFLADLQPRTSANALP